jgi:hypothetical protein
MAKAAFENAYQAVRPVSAELSLIRSDNMTAQQMVEGYLRKSLSYYNDVVAGKDKARDDAPSFQHLTDLLWGLKREMRSDLGT